MSRRSRSDHDKARAYVALQVNDGNIDRSSRDTNIPAATIRDWKHKWEADGVPEEVLNAQLQAVDTFAEDATVVRNKALAKLSEMIDEGVAIKPRDLVVAIGVLDDKITRARGLPTSRTEQLTVGIQGTPAEVQALFTNWAQKSIEASTTRDAEIIETTAVEIEQPDEDSVLDMTLESD